MSYDEKQYVMPYIFVYYLPFDATSMNSPLKDDVGAAPQNKVDEPEPSKRLEMTLV